MLKQQKVQLNLLCAWNLIDKYQDPFRDCHFPQLKVDIRPLGAFQRTRDADSVFLYQEYAKFCVPPYTFHGERCCHAAPTQICDCADTQHTPKAFSLCACFSPPASSFHPPEEQSQRLKDPAKVPCYAEERDTLTQLSISFAHLHVCGTL